MPFSLLVRRSPEGDSKEVTVNADDTVDALVRLAAASFSKEGGAAVCFCGQVLRPEVTLASAGVTAAHFVVLCFPDKQRAVGAAALRGRPQAQPPLAAPAPPRSAPSLRRVCSGKGWVVHGLLLEYSDGVRTGFFGENDGSPLPLSDDAALLRRGGVWQDALPAQTLAPALTPALTITPNPYPNPNPNPGPGPNRTSLPARISSRSRATTRPWATCATLHCNPTLQP